jgi:hypothetical protein
MFTVPVKLWWRTDRVNTKATKNTKQHNNDDSNKKKKKINCLFLIYWQKGHKAN